MVSPPNRFGQLRRSWKVRSRASKQWQCVIKHSSKMIASADHRRSAWRLSFGMLQMESTSRVSMGILNAECAVCPPWEKEACKTSGCDTYDNDAFCLKSMTECFIKICFSTTPKTIDEKELPFFAKNRLADFIKCMLLTTVHGLHELMCHDGFRLVIMVQLL